MYSLANLRRRAGRTGLTITGITLAMALMVVMFSVGNGVEDSARSILAETGVDIFVQANGTAVHMILGDIDDGRNLSKAIAENDDVRTAYPVMLHTMYAINASMRQAILSIPPTDIANLTALTKTHKVEAVTMNGVIPEMAGAFGGIEKIEGTEFSRKDDPFYQDGTYAGGLDSPLFTHEIQVNKVLMDRLKVHSGDTIYVNNELPKDVTELREWLEDGTYFKVMVVAQATWEGLGSSSGYVHLSELQFLAGKRNDTVQQILVDLKDPTTSKSVKRWIEDRFPQLEAYTVEDFLGEIEQMTAVFRGFGEMILLITGAISVLFTATVMIISVRERTAEIAALRAIGFSRGTIFKGVLAETFLMIMVGFIIGFIIGIGLATALDGYLIGISSETGLPSGFHFVSITWLLLAQMGVVALVFGLISGLIPAGWASRLNIAETLKKE